MMAQWRAVISSKQCKNRIIRMGRKHVSAGVLATTQRHCMFCKHYEPGSDSEARR